MPEAIAFAHMECGVVLSKHIIRSWGEKHKFLVRKQGVYSRSKLFIKRKKLQAILEEFK